VESLVLKLLKLSQKHNSSVLKKYAESLDESLKSFDIDNIEKILGKFNSVKDKFSKNSGGAND